jgi:hypothetical protein
LSLTPPELKRGQLTFNHKYDFSQTVSVNDYLRDSNSYSENKISFFHGNGNFKFTDRLSGAVDYQLSEPRITALKQGTSEANPTLEALSSHTLAQDTAYNLSLDLTPRFLQKLTFVFNLLDHKDTILTSNFNATTESFTTRNETYHSDLNPFSTLSTSFDHNRQERTSYIIGGVNPKSERSGENVRYTPLSWLATGWTGTQSESIPETGVQNKTTGNSNGYDVDWLPVSLSAFKLSSHFSLADNTQTAPSGTVEPIKTETDSFSQNYTIDFIPHPIIPMTLGLTKENYKNKNNHPIASSRIDTETDNQTINFGFTVSPVTRISLNSNYNRKTTRILKDLTLTPQERNKVMIDNRITLQLGLAGLRPPNRR